MRLTGTEDLRVRRTITSIKQTFIKLMNEKDFERITVKELSERASINKKTFYFYYSSLNALLEEMQDEILDRYIERVEGYGIRDLKRCIREFFIFFTETEPGAYCIVSRDTTGTLFKKFIELDERSGGEVKARWEKLDSYKTKLVIAFLNMSVLHAVTPWWEAREKVSLDEAVDAVATLTLNGVLGLLDASGLRKK